MSLIEKLKLGSDNVKLMKWPGNDQQVIMKILSQKELQEAAFATERFFKNEKIESNLMTAEEYQNEKAIQMMFRSLKEPDDQSKSIANNITEFRSLLTKNELSYLIAEYLLFEDEVSPRPENLSNDEFDRLFESVKKNSATTISNITSSATLKKLLLTMANQLATLPTVNG